MGEADAGVDAVERVYRAEYARLVALARLLIDRPAEAEEVVQEAFVRALTRGDAVERHDDPLPYLRRAVVNLCRDGLRRRRTVRRTRLDAVDDAPPADVAVLLDERQRAVVAALRTLPTRQRECVVLRYLLDCSTQEAADALGISAGSIKTHLSRALDALEVALEDQR